MRSSAWLLVVLALLARSAKAQAGGDRDLLASLANAEICPAGAHCLPFQTSRQVHRSQGDAGTVMLPVGAMSNVYFRVPPAASLDLEFAISDSSLAVTAGTEADERVLLRAGSLVEEGRRVTLDLGPWGGTSSGYASGPRRAARVPHPAPASDGPCWTTESAVGTPSSSELEVGARPNVVAYLIDTLRADHLGCYGYERITSPPDRPLCKIRSSLHGCGLAEFVDATGDGVRPHGTDAAPAWSAHPGNGHQTGR